MEGRSRVERGNSPGLTRAEGRRFALTLAAAFAVLAAFFHWRDHGIALAVTAVPATLLLLAGLAVPARLGPVERGWMALAARIARVMNPVVMGAIYYLVITTVGLLRRTFKGNPLARAPEAPTYWTTRDGRGTGDMRRQF